LIAGGEAGDAPKAYRAPTTSERTEVVAAHGDTVLEAIDVHDRATEATTRLESGGLFILIGADAETAWLPPEIALDRNGFILTGPDVGSGGGWELDRDPYLLETSVPGVFACGDVRFSPVKRVAAAVGEGSMAIAFVHQYLREAEAAAAPQLREAEAAHQPLLPCRTSKRKPPRGHQRLSLD
jgi:thioredoxin reductase (NADPH)